MGKFKIVFILVFSILLNTEVFSGDFSKEMQIKIDDKFVEFNENVVFSNGDIFLPFREFSDNVGASIEWDNSEKSVFCYRDENDFSFRLNEKEIISNGKRIVIDTPAEMINGKVFVPVCIVEKGFGADVSVDNSKNIMQITFDDFPDGMEYDIKDYDGEVLIHTSIEKVDDISVSDRDGSFTKNSKATLPYTFFERRQNKAKDILNNSVVSAKTFLKEKLKYFGYDNIYELKKEAMEFRKNNYDTFKPYECKLVYDVATFDNFVSIKESLSLKKGSDELINRIVSNVYSIDSSKKASLNNISMKLLGKNDDYLLDYVKKLFMKKVEQDSGVVTDIVKDMIEKFNSNDFYFSNKGFVFFLNGNKEVNGSIEVIIPVQMRVPTDF